MGEQKDKEAFLSRWSRRKLDSAREAPAPEATPKSPAAPDSPSETRPLPSVDELGPDADFSVFMGKEVEEGVRRAALKKLFADPRFNVMDGLDTYTEDYTQAETISAEMLASLEHAKHTLFGPRREEKDEPAQKEEAAQKRAAAPAIAPPARDESSAAGAPESATEEKPEGEDGAAG